jgi:crotonobetainyl-CoA:carnitine CoA-transferase CaiB-like acyl-CoA transferase
VALLHRERGGDGSYVPVSLIQAAVSGLVNQATNWLVAGHSPQRMGSAHPNIAPYGTPYATADHQSIVLAVGTDRQFAALCEILGHPDLADDSRFATNADRVEHRDALTQILDTQIGRFEAEDLLTALHEHNVPAGKVRDVPAVFGQPTAQAMTLDVGDGLSGLRQTAFPHPDGTSPSLSAPPHYAEHTSSILQERLGYAPRRIDALASEEVIVR